MILSDRQIIERCQGDTPMLTPFFAHQVATLGSRRLVSYGLSSYGYDIRLAREYLMGPRSANVALDPKAMHDGLFRRCTANGAIAMPPHSFLLGASMEHFTMPMDILGLCVGKSTYARIGVIVNVTPLEPGWQGILTLEISNTTDCVALLYPEEGIAQIVFAQGSEPPLTSYASRQGKYQDQVAAAIARL